jgi:hypothetical protein
MKDIYSSKEFFIGKVFLKDDFKKYYFKSFFNSFSKSINKNFLIFCNVKKSKNSVLIETSNREEIIKNFNKTEYSDLKNGEILKNRKFVKDINCYCTFPIFKLNDRVSVKQRIKKIKIFLINNILNDYVILNDCSKINDNQENSNSSNAKKKNSVFRTRLDKIEIVTRPLCKNKTQKNSLNFDNHKEVYRFSIGQIVNIDNEKEYKIVCRIIDSTIDFLDFNGKTISVNLEYFTGKIKIVNNQKIQNLESFDSNNNIIFRGDLCKILNEREPFSRGTILLVKNDKAFVAINTENDRSFQKIALIPCREISLIFQRKLIDDTFSNLPLFSIRSIKRGPFKGLRGKIISVDSKHAELEILSSGKTVKIKKDDILI